MEGPPSVRPVIPVGPVIYGSERRKRATRVEVATRVGAFAIAARQVAAHAHEGGAGARKAAEVVSVTPPVGTRGTSGHDRAHGTEIGGAAQEAAGKTFTASARRGGRCGPRWA